MSNNQPQSTKPQDLNLKKPRRNARPRQNLGGQASTPQHPKALGGGDRDRTDDLLLAKQALSQLSYAPDPQRKKNGGPG